MAVRPVVYYWAQLSSNVESQIEVKRETVVSWWNHNSSFLSGQG